MPSQKRTASTTDRASRSVKGQVRDALMQVDAERLKKLTKVLGNGAMATRVAQNERVRDELLAFIQERLNAISLAQRREKQAMKNRADWFRRLQKGEKGVALPEPTRWSAPAMLYKRAADAVCAGELGRGTELLRQAVESDRATMKAVPSQVQLTDSERTSASEPAATMEVQSGEGCTPTAAPEISQLANRVIAESDTADLVTIYREPKRHAWWEVAEDDEIEKQKQKDNPKTSKRLREPAAQADLERRPAVAPERTMAVQAVKTSVEGPKREPKGKKAGTKGPMPGE
jgi:hypothetical protein